MKRPSFLAAAIVAMGAGMIAHIPHIEIEPRKPREPFDDEPSLNMKTPKREKSHPERMTKRQLRRQRGKQHGN